MLHYSIILLQQDTTCEFIKPQISLKINLTNFIFLCNAIKRLI